MPEDRETQERKAISINFATIIRYMFHLAISLRRKDEALTLVDEGQTNIWKKEA